MSDLFGDKAKDWDQRPVPAQISEGVFSAIERTVTLSEDTTVLDFGAGTGLVCSKIAPRVGRVLAVDISKAMLEQLAAKPELEGKVEIFCRDILAAPLDHKVDLVVSAMAMHHVEDTRALLRALFEHLQPGGKVALADLDVEDGSFHPPDTEGVFHAGFDRDELAALLRDTGFDDPTFTTAVEVARDSKSYPVFLVTASRPA
ncbi:MAG: methyltransferase domain-containing protein [Deltaproteobacteria bacterium]|nr:methyltransferase domain-containing protein [Deltaproteobacteria bacterium]